MFAIQNALATRTMILERENRTLQIENNRLQGLYDAALVHNQHQASENTQLIGRVTQLEEEKRQQTQINERNVEENTQLRADFTKQRAENTQLRADFTKQRAENTQLRADLQRQNANIELLMQRVFGNEQNPSSSAPSSQTPSQPTSNPARLTQPSQPIRQPILPSSRTSSPGLEYEPLFSHPGFAVIKGPRRFMSGAIEEARVINISKEAIEEHTDSPFLAKILGGRNKIQPDKSLEIAVSVDERRAEVNWY